MKQINGWLYAAVGVLSLGLFIVGISLSHSQASVKELQQRVTSLDENLDRRLAILEKQLAGYEKLMPSIQGVLNEHQKALEKQGELNNTLLSIAKSLAEGSR